MHICGSNKILNLVLVVAAAVWTAPSFSAEAEDIIKYRQAVMISTGGHADAVNQIVRGKVDYADDLSYHIESIVRSSQTIESLFPEGSDFGETRARDEIWSNSGEFKQMAEKNRAAALALAESVKNNDKDAYQARFDALADACKGCHKKFRRKKE